MGVLFPSLIVVIEKRQRRTRNREEGKNNGERARIQTEKGRQSGGERERERERRRKEAEPPPFLHGPLHVLSLSLSPDVIKTKPRAGPPSRRLINCFVRDTSLFKRNWALSSLPFSWPLDQPCAPCASERLCTCLYSVLGATS